jgi:hypothetical protein
MFLWVHDSNVVSGHGMQFYWKDNKDQVSLFSSTLILPFMLTFIS